MLYYLLTHYVKINVFCNESSEINFFYAVHNGETLNMKFEKKDSKHSPQSERINLILRRKYKCEEDA